MAPTDLTVVRLERWHRRQMQLRPLYERAFRDHSPGWIRIYMAFVEASNQELALMRSVRRSNELDARVEALQRSSS